MTVWPSSLRRWLKAPFRKGVGSNPTAVTCLCHQAVDAKLPRVRGSAQIYKHAVAQQIFSTHLSRCMPHNACANDHDALGACSMLLLSILMLWTCIGGFWGTYVPICIQNNTKIYVYIYMYIYIYIYIYIYS